MKLKYIIIINISFVNSLNNEDIKYNYVQLQQNIINNEKKITKKLKQID